jgi:hypothetical protein
LDVGSHFTSLYLSPPSEAIIANHNNFTQSTEIF